MNIQDIHRFFQSPQPFFLNQELTVCYILSVLVERDSYGTELIQQLEATHPGFRLSDTTLCAALKFLEREGVVTSYWQRIESRGRPRRMYQLRSEMMQEARNLVTLWQNYMNSLHGFSHPQASAVEWLVEQGSH